MVTSLLTSALLLAWMGIVYTWLLEKRTGEKPYRARVSRSVLVAVIVVVIELVLFHIYPASPSLLLLQHVLSAAFLAHLLLFIAVYVVLRSSYMHPVWTAVAAGFDWVVARRGFWRSYRRKRAGRVFRGILEDTGIGRHT
ncbi:MAG: hypothetical protein SVY41_03215 [Candidatus Nanohaloarchaea archaeon]|nr:hypothetical protein [Candidatus Nanohaloarchaea archaeon]